MNTPHRTLLVVGALFALCAAAVFTLTSPPPADGPLLRADAATTQGPSRDGESRSGSASRSDALPDGSELPGRTQADLAPAFASGETMPLRVVVGGSAAPVAGAEVWCLEVNRGRRGGDLGEVLERIENEGTRVVTDASGVAQVPIPRRELAVIGRSGELFGYARVPRNRRESVLTLDLDQTLVVRVVGPDRAPAPGIDVVLAVDLIREMRARRTVTTDARGLATIEHVQLSRSRLPDLDPQLIRDAAQLSNRIATLEQSASRIRVSFQQVEGQAQQQLREAQRNMREIEVRAWQAMRRQQEASQPAGPPRWADFVLAAGVPQAIPQLREFPATAVPTEVVELQLGPLGAIRASVLAADGRPIWMPCTVRLSRSRATPQAPGLEPATFDQLRRLTGQTYRKPAGAEPVAIAQVGADTALDFAVEFEDRDFNFAVADVQGPTAGEIREVELRAPDWLTIVAGRLVDTTGAPLAGLRAELLLSGATGRIEGEPVTTDADGRFEIPVRLREPRPPYTFEVQATIRAKPVGALVDVSALESGGRHDLGDIRVVELPLLVAGRVTDDRDAPIAGARTQLQIFHAAAGDGGAWRDVAYIRMETGEDGSYALYGARREARMRVEVAARNHTGAASPPLQPGATFDAQLDRLGRLIATGFAPEWLPPSAIQLELRRDGRTVRREQIRTRDDETFRADLANLPPGTYAFEVMLQGFGSVTQAREVLIAPGATLPLPPIDLRGRLFRYEVRCVDAENRPVTDPGSPLLARVEQPDGSRGWSAFAWRGDHVEFISAQPNTEVVLLGYGRRPTRDVITQGRSQLTLRRVPPIELEIPGLRQLLSEARTPISRVRISLVRIGDTDLPVADLRAVDQQRGRGRNYQRAALGKASGADLGDDDRVSVSLMLDGDYEVVVRLHGGGGKVISPTIGVIPVSLDGPQPVRATVPAPVAMIREALRQLGS